MNALRVFLLSAAGLLLVACGRQPSGAVSVSEVWIPAAPPTARVMALYAQIESTQDDVLLRITTPVAGSVEVHTTVEEDGMMRMRSMERLELAAGIAVALQPGGMHGMLMDLRDQPAAGAQVPVTFHFERAGDVVTTAQVR